VVECTAVRLALLSDVHANPDELDAVLADIQRRGGADRYWVLGDLVSPGYDPGGVLRRLTGLPEVAFVRGNTDRYTLGDVYPHLSVAEAQADPSLVPGLVAAARVGAWAHGYLTGTGWIDWLAGLPLELRTTLPGGTRLLGVHAAPGQDDGSGIEPDATDDQLADLLRGCGADLVCVGHTHRVHERRVDLPEGPVHVVNVGAVAGLMDEPCGSYGLLEADAAGYRVAVHRVAYDRAAEEAQARRYLPRPGPVR
jgi:predicted phosphodiesterase